jgi:outer membrane biosynthesis protein TonB
VAGAIGVGVLLVAIVGGGSGSPSPAAPIREVADPAPRVVVKATPTHRRRRALGEHRKPALKRQPKGQLEEGEREPKKASAKPHEQAAPEPAPVAEAEPEPIVEPTPEPPPVVEPPPAPTPPAAEFGM